MQTTSKFTQNNKKDIHNFLEFLSKIYRNQRGAVSMQGGCIQQTETYTHKGNWAAEVRRIGLSKEEPVRFKPGSVHRRTEPVDTSI
jgi:hypothetical protein